MLLVGLLALATLPALGQGARLLPAEDPAMAYIQRLQHRGHLLSLHPTAQPYTMGAVTQALMDLDRDTLRPIEARWVELIESYLGIPDKVGENRLGGELTGGIRANNRRRLDTLRPLDDNKRYARAQLDIYLAHGPLVANFGIAHDNYWEREPDGLDAVNRGQLRSDRGYLGFSSDFFDAHLGRFDNHWGPTNEMATIISPNPRSYDRLALRLGNDTFALRSIVGELDNITADGRYTGTAGADSVGGSERRYVAAHRLDWRPTKHFIITITEGVLFSGPNTGLSLKYLNPMHPYVLTVDNRPKNEENNGMVGMMVWGQAGNMTLQAQMMIDDVDLSFGDQPIAFATTGSLHAAALTPAMDLHLAFEAVASRAYNAEQAEGRFQYLNRGLAVQFNDYLLLEARLDLFADGLLPGLTIRPGLEYLAQGRAVINQPNPPNEVRAILSGRLEKTLRTSIDATWLVSRYGYVRLDVGVNRITDRGGQVGLDQTLFVGQLEFGARLPFDIFYK